MLPIYSKYVLFNTVRIEYIELRNYEYNILKPRFILYNKYNFNAGAIAAVIKIDFKIKLNTLIIIKLSFKIPAVK